MTFVRFRAKATYWLPNGPGCDHTFMGTAYERVEDALAEALLAPSTLGPDDDDYYLAVLGIDINQNPDEYYGKPEWPPRKAQ